MVASPEPSLKATLRPSAALAGDLDDQADHPGRVVFPVDHQHVADLAHAVARGVEDVAPGQSGDEDSGVCHTSNLVGAGWTAAGRARA